jgi:hypothetical protein
MLSVNHKPNITASTTAAEAVAMVVERARAKLSAPSFTP